MTSASWLARFAVSSDLTERANAAIARELTIGETTVKTHVTRILAKLALRDRAHAVIYGYETGLVRPGDARRPGR